MIKKGAVASKDEGKIAHLTRDFDQDMGPFLRRETTYERDDLRVRVDPKISAIVFSRAVFAKGLGIDCVRDDTLGIDVKVFKPLNTSL